MISVINVRLAGKLLSNTNANFYTPLGSIIIAQTLVNAGFNVKHYDFQPKNSGGYEEELYQFLITKSAVLAISTIFVDLPFLLPAISRLKKSKPNTLVILGGPGVTGISNYLRDNFDYIDLAIEGDGRGIIVDAISRLTGLSPNEDTRDSSNYILQSSNILNLIQENNYKIGTLATTFGCFYNCIFCSIPNTWGNKVIKNNIVDIVNQIESLQKTQNIKHFTIVDDVFTVSISRIKEFCLEIIRRNIDITWDCFGRIDLFNANVLAIMVSAGLKNIYYGVESGSERVLKIIGKKFFISDAIRVITLSRKFCGVTASFIWSLPFEEMSDFRMTVQVIDYLHDIDVEIQQSAICPLPATPICEKYFNNLIFDFNMIPNATGVKKDELFLYEKTIRSHPKLFSGFYQIEHSSICDKWHLASELGYIKI